MIAIPLIYLIIIILIKLSRLRLLGLVVFYVYILIIKKPQTSFCPAFYTGDVGRVA
jgi:hypothetical protein